MLHVGLDLSRKRVDVCLISSDGELVKHFRAPSDRDGLYGLTRRVAVYGESVRGVVESMNGARFVHDALVKYGWEVLVADAQRVKGLAPLACKTDKVDARVLAELFVQRPRAGDLAADARAARRAGAREAAAPGQAPGDPQAPGPRIADRLRPSGPDG
jgi:Transposase